MDDLRELISLVRELPNAVLWVLGGYLFYKLVVIGSVFGLARLAIERTYQFLAAPRRIEYVLDDITISPKVASELRLQIERLRHHAYIHESGVERLRAALNALDEVEAKGVKVSPPPAKL